MPDVPRFPPLEVCGRRAPESVAPSSRAGIRKPYMGPPLSRLHWAWQALLLGCAERSKPQSRVRRAEGAGLDRECADRATIIVAATREFRRARPIDDGSLFCRISFHQY